MPGIAEKVIASFIFLVICYHLIEGMTTGEVDRQNKSV